MKERDHNLLWMEEAKLVKDLRRYNLGKIEVLFADDEDSLKSGDCLIWVDVAGLEDGRPSVMRTG